MSEVVARSITRSYATQFQAEEDPLSEEGGIWVQGRTHGIDWVDIKSTGGLAIGDVSRAPSVITNRQRAAERLHRGGNPGHLPRRRGLR